MNEYARKIRREIHQKPEIGYELHNTLAILRRELDEMGVEYTEKYGRSSLVATVNPEKSHRTIAIRADMDALPIKEMCEVEYKSQNEGVMHACGHDAHTAILLATLKELHEMRDKISCRVRFIFQAAEEIAPHGAKLMVDDGVMDGVDEILALHVDSDIDAGSVAFVPEYMNATSDGFTLTFHGKSAHVAFQQYGVDAIMMAVRAYNDLEFVIAKEVSAREAVIFNVGSIHAGHANNIICDKAEMYCSLRTHNEDTEEYILNKVKKICESVAETAGGRFEYNHIKHYPALYNDKEISKRLRATAQKVVKETCIYEKRRSMGGEDFAYYGQKKPACMFRLGVKNESRGIVHGLHTSLFDIDEEALGVGVEIFKTYVLDNME